MNDKFQELANLGVGDFEHLDGTLVEHLTNTKALLCQWGASLELQDAGLYHAAYGLSLIHIPSPRDLSTSRMPSSA